MVIPDLAGEYTTIVDFCVLGQYWRLCNNCSFLSFLTFFDAMRLMFSSSSRSILLHFKGAVRRVTPI